jgi:hypothetical protein
VAIKFSKIEPGVTLYDVRRTKMGNTMISEWSMWPVKIISVARAAPTARVVWNTYNPESTYQKRQLERLYKTPPKAYREQEERRKSGHRWL